MYMEMMRQETVHHWHAIEERIKFHLVLKYKSDYKLKYFPSNYIEYQILFITCNKHCGSITDAIDLIWKLS